MDKGWIENLTWFPQKSDPILANTSIITKINKQSNFSCPNKLFSYYFQQKTNHKNRLITVQEQQDLRLDAGIKKSRNIWKKEKIDLEAYWCSGSQSSSLLTKMEIVLTSNLKLVRIKRLSEGFALIIEGWVEILSGKLLCFQSQLSMLNYCCNFGQKIRVLSVTKVSFRERKTEHKLTIKVIIVWDLSGGWNLPFPQRSEN